MKKVLLQTLLITFAFTSMHQVWAAAEGESINIFDAIDSQDLNKAAQEYKNKGILDVIDRDPDKETTPLLYVIEKKPNIPIEFIKAILEIGANPNGPSERLQNSFWLKGGERMNFDAPLITAVETGNMPLADLLIEKGAKVGTINIVGKYFPTKDGKTPLELAIEKFKATTNGPDKNEWLILMNNLLSRGADARPLQNDDDKELQELYETHMEAIKEEEVKKF